MNRLLSDEPREVIIYKIIKDGIYRHIDAAIALQKYINHEEDEAINRYYDTMDSNEDALEDAYNEALLCADSDMQDVSRFLEEYLRIACQILDDIGMCELTDEELLRLTENALYALEQAEDSALKCLALLHIHPED